MSDQLAASGRQTVDWALTVTTTRRIQLVLHPDDRPRVEAYEKQLQLYPGSFPQLCGAETLSYSIVTEPGEPVAFLPEWSRYLRAGEYP